MFTSHLMKTLTRMRNPIVTIILLSLVLVSGCSRSPAPSPHSPLASDAVVLAFGDSITFGTGASSGESYPERLSALTGLKVINAGIPGETTAGGLRRLPETVAATKPDLVLLCLGGNDFLRRVNRVETRSNLEQMLDLLKKNNVPVILVSVPEFGLGLTGKLKPSPMYDELAEEYALVVENEILASVLSQRALKSDSIHPNAQGYAEIASALKTLMHSSGLLN